MTSSSHEILALLWLILSYHIEGKFIGILCILISISHIVLGFIGAL